MSRDPREAPMNDAARRVMVVSNYDPHYATLEDRCLMETRLWLARFDVMCKLVGVNPATFLHMLANPPVNVCPHCGGEVNR